MDKVLSGVRLLQLKEYCFRWETQSPYSMRREEILPIAHYINMNFQLVHQMMPHSMQPPPHYPGSGHLLLLNTLLFNRSDTDLEV